MLCTLSRWMISRTEDTGKKLPGFVERHIGPCPACSAFARASMALASGLRSERPDLLAEVPDFAVDLDTGAPQAEPERRRAGAASRGPRRFLLGLRPLPAAAAGLILVAGAALIFQAVRREPGPTPQDRLAARAAIKSLTSAPDELQGAVGQAESALDRERRSLEKSVVSAVDYLQARLNITIERKDRSKPL